MMLMYVRVILFLAAAAMTVMFLTVDAFAAECRGPTSIFPGRSEVRSWGLEVLDVKKSWPFLLGNKDVVVAVIDTGLDLSHPDFKDRLWVNPGESGLDRQGRDRSKNKIDDDANGFVDDIHGWNFAANNGDLWDRHGHGTHIAGIIAGRATGVSPNARLMILKFYDPAGDPKRALPNTIEAIEYATKMNAQLINFSAGGPLRSDKEQDAIKKAGKKGIAFIAAAGNEKSNSDLRRYYPAGYDLPNIISVGAINSDFKNLAASNFGIQTVDFAAPGGAICSAALGGGFELMSGTSQATAFTTGVAALVLGRGSLEPRELIRRLSATGLPNSNLSGRTKFGVQLNSYRALAMKDEGYSVGEIKPVNIDLIREEDFGTTGASFDPEARPRH